MRYSSGRFINSTRLRQTLEGVDMGKGLKSRKKRDQMRRLTLSARFYLIPTSKGRAAFIKKHRLFDMFGDNVFWQPRKLPTDPKYVRIHNNVVVSTDVRFFNHDVSFILYGHEDEQNYREYVKPIEIMDNVLIGGGSIILPDVQIGPNAIVAAGSVVTRDVPEGVVVAGSPARVVGTYTDFKAKHLARMQKIPKGYKWDEAVIEQAWREFETSKAAERNESGKYDNQGQQ